MVSFYLTARFKLVGRNWDVEMVDVFLAFFASFDDFRSGSLGMLDFLPVEISTSLLRRI
jgi:hypothetical protein